MNSATLNKIKVKAAASSKYLQKLLSPYEYVLNEIVANHNEDKALEMLAISELQV